MAKKFSLYTVLYVYFQSILSFFKILECQQIIFIFFMRPWRELFIRVNSYHILLKRRKLSERSINFSLLILLIFIENYKDYSFLSKFLYFFETVNRNFSNFPINLPNASSKVTFSFYANDWIFNHFANCRFFSDQLKLGFWQKKRALILDFFWVNSVSERILFL